MRPELDEMVELDRLNMGPIIAGAGGRFDSEFRRARLAGEITTGAEVLYVRREERLAAYLEYQLEPGGRCKIRSIQIHPEFRAGPILRKLLGTAWRRLKENPPSLVTTSVHSNNATALRLHRKLGFRATGESGGRVLFEANGNELLSRLARFSSLG